VGGWESTAYALETGQRSRSLWRPYMAPIKIIMTTAMALMLLQALAELCRDLARALGRPLPARAGTTDEAEPVASR
jgi:TRAP-type mannitol/chloroaromatic compound transport system permease small subunit